MAIIAPFKGLTYNYKKISHLSRLVTPPYDVISPDEQEKYYGADPYNVIRLILGKKKTGDSDWDNRYTRSADYLKRWESEDILIRAESPRMYITSLTYDPGDGNGARIRWGLIALVRIEDDSSGVILPHEKTFSAHKDDRLRLMRSCSAQLSQIFGLYEDPNNLVSSCLKKTLESPPEISFDLKDGTSHRMWIVDDESTFQKVADAMKERAIFIADGHHRYETSRNFRNILRARYGARPPNRSYEYVMMYLTNMDDAGLTILPSHRLIKRWPGLEISPFFKKLERWFEISILRPSSLDRSLQLRNFQEMLAKKINITSAIGFYLNSDENFYLFSLKPGARNEMGEDIPPSLKELDVLVLSHFILQKSLGFNNNDLDNEKLFHYTSDMGKAVSLVDSGACQMTFLLNPTKMRHVKEVASNSLIMPRKSTYFSPKTLTGLVFNKIDPHETIMSP